MRWSDVDIHVGEPRAWKTGIDARRWLTKHYQGLVNPKDKNTVVLYRRSPINWKKVEHVFRDTEIDVLLKSLLGADRVRCRGVLVPAPVATKAVRRSTENVIDVKPRYEVRIELGDPDLLFEPFSDADAAEPWKAKGVQERLQVLGYQYAPLGHSEIEKRTKACWEYYRRVHKEGTGREAGEEAVTLNKKLMATLRKEIAGNLLTGAPPWSGEVCPASRLPAPGHFAALRFPGGFCLTYPRSTTKDEWDDPTDQEWRKPKNRPTDADAKYDVSLLDDQHKLEKVFSDDNDKLGRFPIMATVVRILPDGKREPAAGVPVYFQLVDPEALPDRHPLRPHDLRATGMDYSVDRGAIDQWEPDPPALDAPVTPGQWKKDKEKAREIFQAADAEAQAVIEAEKRKEAEAKKAKEKAGSERSKLEDERVRVKKDYGAWNTEATKNHDSKRKRDEADRELESLPEFNKSKYDMAVNSLKRLETSAKKSKEKSEQTNDPKDIGFATKDAEAVTRKKAEITAMEKARDDRAAAKRKYDQADTEYQQAQEEAALGNPYKQEYDEKVAAVAAKQREVDEADAAEKAAARKQREAVHEIAKAKSDKDLAASPQKPSVDYVLNAAKQVEDRTVLIYRYLLSGTGDGSVADGGPKAFVDDVMSKLGGDPKDPQRHNAPEKYGGRAGKKVWEGIFEVADRTRFNDGHGDHGALPCAKAAGGPHEHAVVADTNATGKAGVVFTPSRLGGDCYRLRAYLGPETLDQYDVLGSSAETGTLVTWRNLRIGRYLQKASVAQGALSDKVKAMLEWPAANLTPQTGYVGVTSWDQAYDRAFLGTPMVKVGLGTGWPVEATYRFTIPGIAKSGYRPVDVDFISLSEQFNRCFIEVLVDATDVELLGSDLHQRAIEAGIAAASPHVPTAIDWPTLIFHDTASPFMVNVRHIGHYNHLKPRPDLPDLTAEDEKLIKAGFENFGIYAMMSVFAEGGYYPGLTLVQLPRGDAWDQHALSAQPFFSSGIACPSRSAFIFYTEGAHRSHKFPYSATCNAVHELGHALMGEHQNPNPGGDPDKHVPQPADSKPSKPTEDACVMGYMGGYGEFCGRCVLRLRGWKSKSGTTKGGV